MSRRYGTVNFSKIKEKDGATISPLPMCEPIFPHPDDGRRLVGLNAEYSNHKDARSSKGEVHVAYPDEAITALLTMGGTAASQMASLSSQRLSMTAVNLGLVSAMVTYLASDRGFDFATITTVQFLGFAVAMLLLALMFSFIVWSIGAAEVYYYHIMSGANAVCSSHYDFKVLTREADQNYKAAMVSGKLKGVLGQHTYVPFVLINFLIPVIGLIAIALVSL